MKIIIRLLALGLSGYLMFSWTAIAADPALTRFVQKTVDSNPRVQAARAALDASGALKNAASRPLYNPELSFDAENTDVDTRTLGISQTIDWGSKRSARTVVAEAEQLRAEAEYLRVRWNITLELLGGLAQHQTGLERTDLAEERQRVMNDFANLAQRRFNAGDLNQVELDLSTLASIDARLQQATVTANLAEARQKVRNLVVNSEPTQWPTLAVIPPELPSKTTTTSNLQAIVKTLPEVRVAQREVEISSATVELRNRERRPDPTISLTGGDEDDETLIGLNLSIPLYVRNSFDHEVTAALAEENQSQQLSNDVMRRAHARLVSAAERYQLSQGAWGDWERRGQISLDRQSDLLRRLWEAGEISSTDYLVQLRQTLDVQDSALDLRQTLWEAWFEWLAASGQVDQWLTP